MSLPRKIKHFNLFVDGHNYVGKVSQIVLPKLTAKMEEWRGGGMDGPIDCEFGMEKLSMQWTIGGIERQVFEQFGALSHNAVGLRFAGALQSDDTEAFQAIEINVRGRHREIDPGTIAVGDDTAVVIDTSISYYKLTLNGEVINEIDLPNMIKISGGVDRLLDVRTLIGL